MLQTTLTSIDGAANDGFGFSVSITSNYATIGANTKNNGTISSVGAAYIFQRINGVWLQYQKIVRPNGLQNEFFGNSVAIDANRFLIGARGFQSNIGMVVFGKIEN